MLSEYEHLTQPEIFRMAQKFIPGGVHSPVRSFKGLDISPRFIDRASGAYIQDVDGNKYIDFCMSFGPLILGHGNRKVREAIASQLHKGWSYGACETISLDLAKLIVERLPFIDQVRFVNSGTEAVMTAIRLARGYSKRNKIIKFNGCYHGHSDSMLIKSGSGLSSTFEASSAGIPPTIVEQTIVCELGDLAGLGDCFKRYAGQIAAIIIEPLPANYGLLVQKRDFLAELKTICERNGALLIFDEVISGMRVDGFSMANKLDIVPDIIVLGKIIGGGLPVGALGAKSEIMQHLSPQGDVYQAGTLSANPLAMASGLATLEQLTPNTYKLLESNTMRITEIFRHWLANHDRGKYSHIKIIACGNMFWPSPVGIPSSAKEVDSQKMNNMIALLNELLHRGVYLSPNVYEVNFISTEHNENLANDLRARLL